MKVSGNKSRVKQLHRMDSLKAVTSALAKGDVVEIKDYIEHTSVFDDENGIEQKRVADYLEVTAKGVDYRLPVSEFTKYAAVGENPAYKSEGDKCAFPKSFTIDSAKARTLNTDDSITLFPIRAYSSESRNKMRNNEITWVDLVSDANNLREDNTFAPIQDYVISTQY